MSPLKGEPPLLRKGVPIENAGAARRPAGLRWAERSRVKVERERSDRTLRRRSEANRWGRRAAEADESTRGSRGSEADPTGGCGEITRGAGKHCGGN